MATLKDLKFWMKALNRFGDNIEVTGEYGSPSEKTIHFNLYTATNRYSVMAIERDENDYLGCNASCRKPRAGESWTRGRDLADGDLSAETWLKILSGIVSYEMVGLHKQGLTGNAQSEAIGETSCGGL